MIEKPYIPYIHSQKRLSARLVYRISGTQVSQRGTAAPSARLMIYQMNICGITFLLVKIF
jgi:hypothetical protein